MNWYKRAQQALNPVIVTRWGQEGIYVLIDGERNFCSGLVPPAKKHLDNLIRNQKWDQAKDFCKTLGCTPQPY